jgi:hypothetical protein
MRVRAVILVLAPLLGALIGGCMGSRSPHAKPDVLASVSSSPCADLAQEWRVTVRNDTNHRVTGHLAGRDAHGRSPDLFVPSSEVARGHAFEVPAFPIDLPAGAAAELTLAADVDLSPQVVLRGDVAPTEVTCGRGMYAINIAPSGPRLSMLEQRPEQGLGTVSPAVHTR